MPPKNNDLLKKESRTVKIEMIDSYTNPKRINIKMTNIKSELASMLSKNANLSLNHR